MKRLIEFNFVLVYFLIAFLLPTAWADNKDYHDQDLSKKDFSSSVMNGANFSNAILRSASFRTSSLKNANFKGADLTSTDFYQADLTGADLRDFTGNPSLAYTKLDKANMEGTTVLQPGFRVSFRGTNLKGAKITGVFGDYDFTGADLRGANLRGCMIDQQSRFRGAIYDDDTAWPDGFDPAGHGCVLSKGKDAPAATTGDKKD